jgi:hypothetical protein
MTIKLTLPVVVIMFLISAATALAAIMATVLACSIIIDSEQRIREERITDSRVALGIMRDRVRGAIFSALKRLRRSRNTDQSERALR